jgi:phage FluMu gp28-like protein
VSSAVRGRIDRAFGRMLRTRKDEDARNSPLVTCGIIEFCLRVLRWKPYPYQEKLLLDPAKFIAARMSRQSGKSTTLAVLALYTALSTPNARVYVVAPSLRQARLIVQKAWTLARRVPGIFRNKPLKTRLEFRDGSIIQALPNSPETIRGETSNLVILDEFNYVRDDQGLYDAVVFTLMTTNGRAVAASTPGSRDSIFYHMCTDQEGPYANVSRHHVTCQDATEPNGPIKREVLEQVRIQYGADQNRWIREMEAEFADDEDCYLPMSLILSCVDPELEPIPSEYFLSGLDPEERRRLESQLAR